MTDLRKFVSLASMLQQADNSLTSPLTPPLGPPLSQLKQKSCILYNIGLKNRKIQSLIDSGSKVNAILRDLVKSLKLFTLHTHWSAVKIDGSCLATFGIVLTTFAVKDKHGYICWFEKTFFSVNITHDVVLGMLFLKLADPNI